jgi:cyclopropane fatty-acyl-phospholipid synthase-like methyltransferase
MDFSERNRTIEPHPDFDESYKAVPPWDIGRPQSDFILLDERGELRGSILDVGCGTGENALFFASRGHVVVGIDSSPRAINKAQNKARERKVAGVTFFVGDALYLSRELKGTTFDNITDCGLFHVLTDQQRLRFIESLRSVLKENGKYFMLCFSDLEPSGLGGPRRVSQEEIRESFSNGWVINYIKEARLETNFDFGTGRAWLSSITMRM